MVVKGLEFRIHCISGFIALREARDVDFLVRITRAERTWPEKFFIWIARRDDVGEFIGRGHERIGFITRGYPRSVLRHLSRRFPDILRIPSGYRGGSSDEALHAGIHRIYQINDPTMWTADVRGTSILIGGVDGSRTSLMPRHPRSMRR
jgi:hypothetical protein